MNEYVTTNENGDKFYYKDKARTILHREGGPAIEWHDGGKAWYLNGKLHRMDGPAVVWRGGSKAWWVNNVFIFEIDGSGDVVERMK